MSRNRVCSPRVVDTLPPHLPSTAGGCLSLGRCSVRMCSSWFRERQGGRTSSASLKLFTTFHVARRVPGFCRAVFPGPEYRALTAPLQASRPVRQEGAQRPTVGRAGGWRSPRPELRDRRRGHLPFPSLARGVHPSLFVPSSGPVRSPPLPVTPIQEIVLPFQRHPPPCPPHCPLSTSCF